MKVWKISLINQCSDFVLVFNPLISPSDCTFLDLVGLIPIIFIAIIVLSFPLILFSIPNGFIRILRDGKRVIAPILTGTGAGASNAIVTRGLNRGNNQDGNTGVIIKVVILVEIPKVVIQEVILKVVVLILKEVV